MPLMKVTLPNNVSADLYYGHDYPGGVYDYIQLARAHSLLIKQSIHNIEETYWLNLQKYRTAFANQIPAVFDLIVSAPSNSGWHLPFVSAVREGHPKTPCIYFIKDPKNSGAVKAFADRFTGLGAAQNILIVDDVYSTGKIAASVVDKLQQYGTRQTASYMIACPLRMPPQQGGIFASMLPPANDPDLDSEN